MSFFKKFDFRVRHDGRTPPKLEGGLGSGRGSKNLLAGIFLGKCRDKAKTYEGQQQKVLEHPGTLDPFAKNHQNPGRI